MAEMTMILEGFISQYLWRDDCSGRSIFLFKTKKDMSNLEQFFILFQKRKENELSWDGRNLVSHHG